MDYGHNWEALDQSTARCVNCGFYYCYLSYKNRSMVYRKTKSIYEEFNVDEFSCAELQVKVILDE